MIWHPYTQHETAGPPLPVRWGSGVWLETVRGQRVLDGISSWWVNIHGHAHPFLNQALIDQATKLEHVMFAGFTHEPAVELAERLIEILPKGLARVFYSDNGSTAVEVALKMGYQYWLNKGECRQKFVALTNAYHGDTFGAMSASDTSSFTEAFRPLLFNVLRADSPDAISCGSCSGRCDAQCSVALEVVLGQNRHSVAAVIVEPMLQGAGGMIVWEPGYLKRVRELCDEFGVLMIADEVLTGFGRTGRMFACEHAGVTPDIICLSKAITAGYLPLGATIATEEIFEAFLSSDRTKTLFHGHSYTANPLACAVACASLDLFKGAGTMSRVTSIAKRLKEGVETLAELDQVADVRTIGAVAAIELKATDAGYLAGIGPMLHQEFLRRDILLRPLGNVVYFMPPYCITDFEIDWVLGEINDVLSNLEGDRAWG